MCVNASLLGLSLTVCKNGRGRPGSIYRVSDIMSTKVDRGGEGPPNKRMHQYFGTCLCFLQ